MKHVSVSSTDHGGGKRRGNRLETARDQVAPSDVPLALSQILDYAHRSAHRLNKLIAKCDGELLPKMTAPRDLVEAPPTETLRTLD